jgi:hypothetical protein
MDKQLKRPSLRRAIDEKRKECIYWLVVDDDKGPLSLVKTSDQKAVVLAGDARGAQGFRNGKPNTFIEEAWYFEQLTNKCYHNLLKTWINKLGPVEDPAQRLKNLREKESKQKISKAKRERAKNLNDVELAEVQNLLSKEVSQNHIADKFGVSQSFIRRLAALNHQNVPEVGVGDSETPEATDKAA